MSRIRSSGRGWTPLRRGVFAVLAAGALLALPAAVSGQDAGPQIVSSQISVSPGEARLDLELPGARRSFALSQGRVLVDDAEVGSYERGDALDRAWRSLLGEAMEVEGAALASLLAGWQAPAGTAAGALASALHATVTEARVAVTAVAPPVVTDTDTVRRLEERIRQLEGRLREREQRAEAQATRRTTGPWADLSRPLRNIMRGVGGMLSTAAMWLVLLLIGAAIVYFGRRNIENVADTARVATLRSWLVGLAGSFLLLPGYILGIIALAISIVGIPLILVWAPFFPVVAALAVLFGYLAVAHASGEALAERRLHGAEWFERGNSYYYLGTGLALLLALHFAAHFVQMAGPWLGFVRGTLTALWIVLTWMAATIGLGAVLLSRGGTRPPDEAAVAPPPDTDALYEEESHV